MYVTDNCVQINLNKYKHTAIYHVEDFTLLHVTDGVDV